MGIGDLLRSTAAWRSLKIKWPDAKLHLLFLSKHPGYSSEKFISKISLLSSATFLTISNDNSNDKKTRIIVSHILENLKNCEKVYEFKNGTIFLK
jgi:hypothetical protein